MPGGKADRSIDALALSLSSLDTRSRDVGVRACTSQPWLLSNTARTTRWTRAHILYIHPPRYMLQQTQILALKQPSSCTTARKHGAPELMRGRRSSSISKGTQRTAKETSASVFAMKLVLPLLYSTSLDRCTLYSYTITRRRDLDDDTASCVVPRDGLRCRRSTAPLLTSSVRR